MATLGVLREHDGSQLDLDLPIDDQLSQGVRRLIAEDALATGPSCTPSARDVGDPPELATWMEVDVPLPAPAAEPPAPSESSEAQASAAPSREPGAASAEVCGRRSKTTPFSRLFDLPCLRSHSS